jgi:hypothetical protein
VAIVGGERRSAVGARSERGRSAVGARSERGREWRRECSEAEARSRHEIYPCLGSTFCWMSHASREARTHQSRSGPVWPAGD